MHQSHSNEIWHEDEDKVSSRAAAARAIRRRKNALQLSARLFSARYLADQMPITIGYWNIRGLAAPLRMLASYAGPTSACRPPRAPFRTFDPRSGEDYIDEQHENHQNDDGSWGRCDWFAHRKPELKRLNPLINLPYVIDGDVVQYPAS